jgi:hypothetical protein
LAVNNRKEKRDCPDIFILVLENYGNTQVSSRIAEINVVRKPSDNKLIDTQSVQDTADQLFRKNVGTLGARAARDAVLRFLRQQSIVDAAGISSDGKTIWIEYQSGISGAILTGPAGTQGGIFRRSYAPKLMGEFFPTDIVPKPCPLPVSTDLTGSSKSIVLAPFFSSFSPYDASDDIAQYLQQACAGQVVELKGPNG